MERDSTPALLKKSEFVKGLVVRLILFLIVHRLPAKRSAESASPVPRRLHSYPGASGVCEKPGFAFWCFRPHHEANQ